MQTISRFRNILRRRLRSADLIISGLLLCWCCGLAAAASPVAAAPVHWSPAGFSGGGFFCQIVVDPVENHILYLAADVSGMYKSTDYGETWVPINKGLSSREVAALAIDPSNHLRLWAGTPIGLHTSNDGGASWSLVRADIRCFKHINYKGISISRDGRLILVAGHVPRNDDPYEDDEKNFTGKLFRSVDAGTTWKVVKKFAAGKRISSVMFDPHVDNQAFLVLYRQGVLRSIDGGRTWQDFSSKLPAGQPWKALEIGKSVLYVTAPLSQVYKRGKKKAGWVSISSSLEPEGDYYPYDPICVAPDNDRQIYLGQEGWPAVIFISSNGGKTWKGIEVLGNYTFDTVHAPQQTWINPYQDPICIVVDRKQPNNVYYTTWWGAWRSQDRGATWKEIVAGTQNTCCTDAKFAGDTLLSSHMDVGLLASPDAGKAWTTAFPRRFEDLNDALHAWSIEVGVDGDTYASFAVDRTGAKVFRSNDNGVTWEDKSRGLPASELGSNSYRISMAADPSTKGKIYLAIDDLAEQGLFVTTDYGGTWVRVEAAPGPGDCTGDRRIKCLKVDPTDPNRIFAGSFFNGPWYSEDGGKTWHQAQGTGADISCGSVQQIIALADGTVYAALDNGVYRSDDHGHTYVRAFPELPGLGEETVEYVWAVEANPSNPQELFAGTNKIWPFTYNRGSVWYSRDGGSNWIDVTADLPIKNIMKLTYRDGYLYAATWCANLFRLELASVPSTIGTAAP